MNEIEVVNQQLPDTLEDLTQFVLVGKAKLNAYMLKLQTVNKLSVAQEIRDQTLKETQEISTALIAAEQRIGELLLAIPKASGGVNQYNKEEKAERSAKSKAETISDMGYDRHEALDYQQMAKNPEIVQKVIEDAIANGEIVTKTAVMKEIKAAKDEAKREMQNLCEERDYLKSKIEELESREPEVKTVTKEVVPEDYESLKKKASKINAIAKDLDTEKRKVDEKQKKILELQDRIAELEGATMQGLDHANLAENIAYFCTMCNNFIGNVGGLVWLTDRIADMPVREREMFLKAAVSFRDWASAFSDNLERSMNGSREQSSVIGISLQDDSGTESNQ